MAKKKAVKKPSKKKLHPSVHELHGFWEKVEHYNAKLITPAIVVLLFVIVVELVPYFSDFAHHYHTYILALDYFVIAVFVVDLTFLAIKAKSVSFFFKSYWLDIIAIFPLALAFTLLTKFFKVVAAGSRLAIGQAILHESLEARKGIQVASRTGKFTKFLRLGARSIRVVTKSRLFSQFDSKHHLAKRKWKTHRRKGTKPNLRKRK
ncbi:hypothetical protein HOD05_05540 [Candidatus Woesearchaeota archaeon]|jgi:hypothetical protein|nr:hypothetical protein [Candidatus Woesearchaeota archaeon]MBT4150489.1 hypothetical protein [Candidatus Woesearchaeota archaeon]MBT4247129.1 hypothetical protein [Candidatus Woesearchaeota archaeon]MBT4434645.1 hypothetical protein [Candidatus Woesearchaeota archaeon]MBT7332619.1 hypothetical protein [Candidatus Woesearchaeota archaeon]